MKIKNDFVTNSSSTSFIFGPQNKDESVDTIFNLIKMICNEILIVYNKMKDDKRIVIPDTFEYGMYSNIELKNLLNDKYINNTFFCLPQNAYMYKYFINVVCMEKNSIEMLEDILKYITYQEYTMCSEFDIIVIHDTYDMDAYFAKECYNTFAFDYYSHLGIKEDEIRKIINSTEVKHHAFVREKLGKIYVKYEEFIFSSLFDIMLKYFSNYSNNVSTYIEREGEL